ncbi:MAG: hypothetical protein ACK5TK_17555 [Betaproteobacteria bacterium]
MMAVLPAPLRTHWFYLALVPIVAIDLAVALSSRGEIDRMVEAGLLFDLALLLPALYWLCYRREGRKALVRAVALACLGVWVAGKLVPVEEQQLISALAPLRYVGLAVVVALEVVLLLAIYRAVFKHGGIDPATAARAEAAGMPPWLLRLLALEARFWARVWQTLRKLGGGR